MGVIISPAGELGISITNLKNKDGKLVVIGRMGLWDAEICFSLKELIFFFFRPSVVLTIIMFPFLYIKGLFIKNKT